MNIFSLAVLCIYALHRVAAMTTERLKMRADMADYAKNMDEEEKYQQQKWMRSQLYESLMYARARRVGIYLGRPDQFDTEEIVAKLLYDQKTVFVPHVVNVNIPKVVKDESIRMVKFNETFNERKWRDALKNMKKNKYGFKEPDRAEKLPEALDTASFTEPYDYDASPRYPDDRGKTQYPPPYTSKYFPDPKQRRPYYSKGRHIFH